MALDNGPILFLGSGASVPFGLPTTKELRDRLRTKYRPKTSHTFVPGTRAGISIISEDLFGSY